MWIINMRKPINKTMLICFLSFAVPLLLTSAARAEPNKYVFGYSLTKKSVSSMESQFMVILSDVIAAFSEKEGVKIEVKTYADLDLFISDVNNNLVDLAVATSDHTNGILLKQNKMTPFLSFELFGRKTNNFCVYAKKGKGFKNLKDLRKKRVLTYGGMNAYLVLRNVVGEPPEFYFDLGMSPNASSMIYSLGLDDSDAIFIVDANIQYFKKTNPGPVRDVAPVVCTEGYNNSPLLRSPRVPEALVKKLVDFAVNIDKQEPLKKYRPLLSQMKIKFYPATRDDFKYYYVDLIDQAVKLGWDKDFNRWKAYQQ